MRTKFSCLIRSKALAIKFFLNPITTKSFSTLHGLRQSIHTQKWEFKDSDRGVDGVFHHTVNAEEGDKNADKVADVIYNTIVSHPNSLFFLTQKSRLLRRSDDNPNYYLPIQKHEFSNISLMLELIKKQWFRPSGGHTCMAITDPHGSILKETHVSLRPSTERILSGKAALHPHLYPPTLPSGVLLAKHTTIEEEILSLAAKMIMDNGITADLTVIPISKTRMPLNDVLNNIQSTRTLKLYNLCSLVVKQKDIDEITDETIRGYVEELKKQAVEFPELQEVITSESDTVLAALACTHAIVKACYGDPHAVDKKIRPDQDTQTAVVYCTMALIGTEKFLAFADKINFHDEISRLTKS